MEEIPTKMIPGPRPSMGLVIYLPTFCLIFMDFHVGKYSIHGFYGDDNEIYIILKISNEILYIISNN